VSPLIFAGFVPHPPLLIEGIGDEEKGEVAETDLAYREFARRLQAASPTTVVIVTPHGPVFSDAYTMAGWETLQGDFAPFGSLVSMSWPNDRDYVERAQTLAAARDLPLAALSARELASRRQSTDLDHGTMLPLWYLEKAGWRGKVVCVRIGGLSPAQCHEIGKILALAAGEERCALVASGDLSHCLTQGAPSPYNPAGAQFDQLIHRALKEGDFSAILAIPPDLRQQAAECGWRPLVTLLGALDGRACRSEVLSYQGPFGVGYLVAAFEPGPLGSGPSLAPPQSRPVDASPHTRLARAAIRHYLDTGKELQVKAQAPLDKRAAAFVSLKLDDQLRGCIGTIEPRYANLAQEIVANAIAAASEDPRFEPVTDAELDQITISVDVLSPPTPAQYSRLDPARLGLIARWQGRQGLLLPDLPGVDTPQEQLRIVCAKAGIPWSRAREAELFTFTVERYH
jgi:AmmeMemoRadiSam system protein A